MENTENKEPQSGLTDHPVGRRKPRPRRCVSHAQRGVLYAVAKAGFMSVGNVRHALGVPSTNALVAANLVTVTTCTCTKGRRHPAGHFHVTPFASPLIKRKPKHAQVGRRVQLLLHFAEIEHRAVRTTPTTTVSSTL